jgi:hypothetical protein
MASMWFNRRVDSDRMPTDTEQAFFDNSIAWLGVGDRHTEQVLAWGRHSHPINRGAGSTRYEQNTNRDRRNPADVGVPRGTYRWVLPRVVAWELMSRPGGTDMNRQDIKDAIQVLWGDMEQAIKDNPSDNLYEIRGEICNSFYDRYDEGIRRQIVKAYVWSGLWGDDTEPIQMDAFIGEDWMGMWYQNVHDTYDMIGNEWTWDMVDGAIDDGCYDDSTYWKDVYGLNKEVK